MGEEMVDEMVVDEMVSEMRLKCSSVFSNLKDGKDVIKTS